MRKKKLITLTTKQYNLLLRTLHTGCGDINEFRQLIQHQTGKKTEPAAASTADSSTPLPLLNAPTDSQRDSELQNTPETSSASFESAVAVSQPITQWNDVDTIFNGVQVVKSPPESMTAIEETLPDILNSKLKLPADIKIQSLESPFERLMLLGNVMKLSPS